MTSTNLSITFLEMILGDWVPQKFSEIIMAKVADADRRGLVQEGQDREVCALLKMVGGFHKI